MKKSGFTLLELLLVVAVISILAAVALPNFSKSAERMKVRDAQAILSSVYSAERVYFLDQNSYGRMAPQDLANDDLIRNGYLSNPDAGDSNSDWTFAATTVTPFTAFTATATRTGGSYNTNTVVITQSFNGTSYGGNHPLRDS